MTPKHPMIKTLKTNFVLIIWHWSFGQYACSHLINADKINLYHHLKRLYSNISIWLGYKLFQFANNVWWTDACGYEYDMLQ